MTTPTITFIGAGNMARSIIHGLVANGFMAKDIWISNPSPEKLQALANQFQVQVTGDNCIAAEHGDVIILAVKPNHIQLVCEELKTIIKDKNPLIISVASGVSADSIKQYLEHQAAIVRAMPNIASAVQAGATALFANQQVSEDQCSLAESIFRAVGLVVWLEKEELMKVALAVSGSGPAYYFLVMEAMQQAAQKMGLPKEVAQMLVTQTALGAARLAMESDQDVEQLRRAVTSPKGTTEQAIHVFNDANLNKIVADAMQAASARAQELGDQLNQ